MNMVKLFFWNWLVLHTQVKFCAHLAYSNISGLPSSCICIYCLYFVFLNFVWHGSKAVWRCAKMSTCHWKQQWWPSNRVAFKDQQSQPAICGFLNQEIQRKIACAIYGRFHKQYIDWLSFGTFGWFWGSFWCIPRFPPTSRQTSLVLGKSKVTKTDEFSEKFHKIILQIFGDTSTSARVNTILL